MKDHDPVNHPSHYTDHPSGVECITVTEHMNFNIGNAIKYLWRVGMKDAAVVDLQKAAWYIQREINRIDGAPKRPAKEEELPLFSHIKDIEAREKAETPAVEIPHSFEFLSQEERRHFLELNPHLEEMK